MRSRIQINYEAHEKKYERVMIKNLNLNIYITYVCIYIDPRLYYSLRQHLTKITTNFIHKKGDIFKVSYNCKYN